MTAPSTPPPPEEPHVGSEDDPRRELDERDEQAVVPPRRYDPDEASTAVDRPKPPPTTMDRVAAASVPLATLAFFAIGFTTGWWFVAWLVFLVPPVLHKWNKPDDD